MEVTQFTYFQQVGGFDCNPVSGEITYGLERLAMYVQGVDRVFDLNFNGRTDARKLTYGDVFLQAEQEYSRYNFEHADTEMLLQHFRDAEKECKALLEAGAPTPEAQRQAPQAGAAGLRPVHQGQPYLQPARRARRHLRDRAAELHPARARPRQGLLRRLARDRGRRGDDACTLGQAKRRPNTSSRTSLALGLRCRLTQPSLRAPARMTGRGLPNLCAASRRLRGKTSAARWLYPD